MGADLILVAAAVPQDPSTVPDRIDTLDSDKLLDLVDDYAPWVMEDKDTDIGAIAEIRAYLVEAWDIVSGDRRDVVQMRFDGRWYYLTGGMTWGDDPSDAYDSLNLIGASGVTDDDNYKE